MCHRFPSWRDSFPRLNLAHPSPGDKLLSGAYGAKIELLRFTDDDGKSELSIDYRIEGTIENQADARQLLATLLREFDGGGEASNV